MDRLPDPGVARRIALLALAGFLTIALLVASGQTARLDDAGLRFWRDGAALTPIGPPWLTGAIAGLTRLGNVIPRTTAALIAAAWLLAKRKRALALWLTATVAGSWAVNSLIKWSFARPRPAIVPHLDAAGGPSFPSGHSFNGAVVWLAVALALGCLSARRSTRDALLMAAVALSLAIAFSRVWLGVHYPSDVAAGWFGGVAWVFGAVWLFGFAQRRKELQVAKPQKFP